MAHGRGITQLIHDPAARSQKPCVRARCAFTPGSDSCGRFQRRYFVRPNPPRPDGAARARGTSPLGVYGNATGNVALADSSRTRHEPAGGDRHRGSLPGVNFLYPFYFVYYPVRGRTDIDCPARGGARARRPTSDVPATEAFAPVGLGLSWYDRW